MTSWRDTVMSEEQLEKVEDSYLNEDFSVNVIRLGRGHTEDLRLRVAQAQAEISCRRVAQELEGILSDCVSDGDKLGQIARFARELIRGGDNGS